MQRDEHRVARRVEIQGLGWGGCVTTGAILSSPWRFSAVSVAPAKAAPRAPRRRTIRARPGSSVNASSSGAKPGSVETQAIDHPAALDREQRRGRAIRSRRRLDPQAARPSRGSIGRPAGKPEGLREQRAGSSPDSSETTIASWAGGPEPVRPGGVDEAAEQPLDVELDGRVGRQLELADRLARRVPRGRGRAPRAAGPAAGRGGRWRRGWRPRRRPRRWSTPRPGAARGAGGGRRPWAARGGRAPPARRRGACP